MMLQHNTAGVEAFKCSWNNAMLKEMTKQSCDVAAVLEGTMKQSCHVATLLVR
jgi:hypothetical protein